MGSLVSSHFRVVGLKAVETKLSMAPERILAHNRGMVTTMLDEIKPEVVAKTPLGPGHFGYHLRDRYAIDVKSTGIKTIGVLKAPVQGSWREWGTRHERRFYVAHKALAAAKKVITQYYGGMAAWYRL